MSASLKQKRESRIKTIHTSFRRANINSKWKLDNKFEEWLKHDHVSALKNLKCKIQIVDPNSSVIRKKRSNSRVLNIFSYWRENRDPIVKHRGRISEIIYSNNQRSNSQDKDQYAVNRPKGIS